MRGVLHVSNADSRMSDMRENDRGKLSVFPSLRVGDEEVAENLHARD